MSTAPVTVPIAQGEDFYVPYFELRLRGRPADAAVVYDVTEVSYKDDIAQIDSFDISINNWDADKLKFKYSDQELFDPGVEVELWMGYYGKLRRMIRGEITQLKPDFPASGQPKLTVSGLNVLHKFRKKQESRPYQKLKPSQIATQIGGFLGVKVRTDPSAEGSEEEYGYLLQNNAYDIVFLAELARRHGYELFVEEDPKTSKTQLYFGPSDSIKKVKYELAYGKSLIQFAPTLTTHNQVGKVTVRAWDSRNKRVIEGTATRADLTTKGVSSRGGQGAIENSFDQREEVIANRPVQSQTEAKNLARETLENIAKDMVKGSGSTVGLPDIRAGNVVQIEGLGKRYSGRYFITSSSHSIGDGGYTTNFECRREELR